MPGLLEETAAAAGCALPLATAFGIARVTFRADGRARKVDLDVTGLPSPCVAVLHALAVTGIADEQRRVAENIAQVQVAPFNTPWVGCVRAASRSAQGSTQPYIHLGEEDQPFFSPKVRADLPALPREVQKAGRPGDVTAELMVSETGCVSAVRVTDGSGNPLADAAVVRAMAGWAYTPVKLGDVPRPFSTVDRIGFYWTSRRGAPQ
jgi:TonB family protein